MKRVFVCSPFSSADPSVLASNVRRARAVCREIALAGDAPFAPHLVYPSLLDDVSPAERALGIACGLRWLQVADEVRVVGSPTAGMQIELNAARARGIPVHPFTQESAS